MENHFLLLLFKSPPPLSSPSRGRGKMGPSQKRREIKYISSPLAGEGEGEGAKLNYFHPGNG
jgi:hypothetical protein